MARARRPSGTGQRRRNSGGRALPDLGSSESLERLHAKFLRQYTGFLNELTDQVLDRLPEIIAEADRERDNTTREDSAMVDVEWEVDPYVDPDTGQPFYVEFYPELRVADPPRGCGGFATRADSLHGPARTITLLERRDAKDVAIVRDVINNIELQYTAALNLKSAEAFVDNLTDAIEFDTQKKWRIHVAAQAKANKKLTESAVLFAVNESPGIPVGLKNKFRKLNFSLIVDKGGRRVPPIPTKHFTVLKRVLSDGIRRNLRVESIRDNIKHLKGVSERRALVLARDQVGKLHTEMMQVRQFNLGVKAYFWLDVGDERVRDEHEARRGVRFLWSNPPPDGHPGFPVNCRCSAIPDLEDALTKLEQAPAPTSLRQRQAVSGVSETPGERARMRAQGAARDVIQTEEFLN